MLYCTAIYRQSIVISVSYLYACDEIRGIASPSLMESVNWCAICVTAIPNAQTIDTWKALIIHNMVSSPSKYKEAKEKYVIWKSRNRASMGYDSTKYSVSKVYNLAVSAFTLKRKCRHFDEILIIGCTGSCHFDNFQCSQWWKFHQNEDISASV